MYVILPVILLLYFLLQYSFTLENITNSSPAIRNLIIMIIIYSTLIVYHHFSGKNDSNCDVMGTWRYRVRVTIQCFRRFPT